ncbi:MAG: magnesium chelatase subunit, partial [Solirubrobacteraceae bacterium]|nr:magnesium chelatase subunit [Solirubrobacteraceae bacterium]
MTPGYPFSAIVGQQALLEALLVNAVSPQVGGVLVRGERGTAKSTAVRALAPLLPAVLAAADQPFCFGPGDLAPDGPVDPTVVTQPRAAPLVELPVGATIDRLVGALDLGRALAGERAFEAGLLARAHQGVLYVDEVNLLPDHLVDVLLDAAAMGVCHVERDAVSVRHDSRFLLVGTMNAEEGELRPQLLDRFGLGVEVRAPTDPEIRAEIVRRRLAYEADPVAFALAYAEADADVAARIEAARERLPRVRLPERELARIVRACAQVGVDGMRGDLVTARAARVLAALEGCDEVSAEHVRRAAHLALVHRRRRDPLDGAATDPADVDRALHEDGERPEEPPPPGGNAGAGGATNGSGSPSDLPASASREGIDAARAPSETREATDLAAPAPRERLDAPERALSVALPEPRGRGAGVRAGASA